MLGEEHQKALGCLHANVASTSNVVLAVSVPGIAKWEATLHFGFYSLNNENFLCACSA